MRIKRIIVVLLLMVSVASPTRQVQAQIPIIDIIKAVAKAVIKKIDLQIQKKQNKVIWLQNAQKTLENSMSKLKLGEISDWTKKQRELYDAYYKELWRVKNALTTYNKVKEIVEKQLLLVEEYKRAWGLLRQDKHFSQQKLDEMYRAYSGILEESLKNIDQLMLVASSFRTQMSDGKRLELITEAGNKLEGNLTDLRSFNGRNFKLSISMADDERQAILLRKMYGIQ